MARLLTRVAFELLNVSTDTKTDYLDKLCDSFRLTHHKTVEHENNLIKYKRELPDNVADQMIKESNPTDISIIIWGIDEDEKYQLTPLENTPDSDTVREIENDCKQETSLETVKIHEIYVDTEETEGKLMLGLMLGTNDSMGAFREMFGNEVS